MELLLVLVTLHLIGDFYLQPDSWVSERNQNKVHSRSLLKHVAVHFILNLIVLSFLKYPALDILILASLIAISHYITDLWKSYQAQTNFYFIIDQLIHFLVLILCWFYLYENAFRSCQKSDSASFGAKQYSDSCMLSARLQTCIRANVTWTEIICQTIRRKSAWVSYCW